MVVAAVARIAPTWRARAQVARDQEYRALAERSARIQEDMSRQLAAISGRLTEVEGRMTSVERVLKDVE
ncbi:hypothetical protein E1193_27155 [Micromonospora sp. KC606]|nr:hypothetical protein E1193_27155 [Micromonospora sp. KC606]